MPGSLQDAQIEDRILAAQDCPQQGQGSKGSTTSSAWRLAGPPNLGAFAKGAGQGLRPAAGGTCFLPSYCNTPRVSVLDKAGFDRLLNELCKRLTAECRAGRTYQDSDEFEDRVRQAIQELLTEFKIMVDRDPHPYGFPDIALGEFGVEVKFTVDDTWRTVANSVFERHRAKGVKHIYVVMAKMGGTPEVKWGRYESSVMHVRTSHVPRFEIEIGTTDPLFKTFGIDHPDFCKLSDQKSMEHVWAYAPGSLCEGEAGS